MDTESIEDIDEALRHATESKKNVRDSRMHIINEFIDDLLDDRNKLTGVSSDNADCVST